MAMTSDDWDALVRRCAHEAQMEPRRYRRRVVVWALAGHAMLFGAFVLAGAGAVQIAVAIVAGDAPVLLGQLAIPVALLASIVLRALTVTLPRPPGVELRPADAPALFEAIERLRVRLKTPRVHQVLLDGSFDISIVQAPRLGPLGWSRNYLTLGLAHLHALAPQELEFMLAHELGHISRSHARFGSWIYRLRNSWRSALDGLDGVGFVGVVVFRRFFQWYVSRLDALTVALVREHACEADRAAAEAVGARHAALALVRSVVQAPAVDGYWNTIYRRVLDDPAPPLGAYEGLAPVLSAAPGEDGLAALERALAVSTDTTDSHPALSDRLRALGFPARAFDLAHACSQPPRTAAAQLFEPDALVRLSELLSNEWHESIRASWTERHSSARHDLQRLRRLDASAAEGGLDGESARERAQLAERLRDDEAALAGWRDVLALDPADAGANLAVGARLLARGDDDGLGHLDRAMDASPGVEVHAAEIGHGYLVAAGRSAEAARYRSRMNAGLDTLGAAVEERRGLSRRDDLQPHGLPSDALGAMTSSLAPIEPVAEAYLVRKRVDHLAHDAPLYVVGVVRASRWWRYERGDADRTLMARVVAEVALPGGCLVVSLSRGHRWLRRRLRRVDGALVFGR